MLLPQFRLGACRTDTVLRKKSDDMIYEDGLYDAMKQRAHAEVPRFAVVQLRRRVEEVRS